MELAAVNGHVVNLHSLIVMNTDPTDLVLAYILLTSVRKELVSTSMVVCGFYSSQFTIIIIINDHKSLVIIVSFVNLSIFSF